MTSPKSSKSNTKRISIISVITLFLIILIYIIDPNLAKDLFGVDNNKAIVTNNFKITNFEQGIPKLPNNYNVTTFHHKYYYVDYSKKYRDPYCVSYILTKKMVQINKYKRKGEEFTKDPLLENDYSITSDYRGSGYDRGHMCPAGDMNFNKTAMNECFYMSNITPQKPGLNRLIWKDLEEKVRDWAIENDSLYIVVGAIYSSRPKRIGKDKVAVPKELYKIVADISAKDGYKAIAFIIANKNYSKNADFMDYAVSIDSLENLTGIDFFANYKNKNVEQIESSVNKNLWK